MWKTEHRDVKFKERRFFAVVYEMEIQYEKIISAITITVVSYTNRQNYV
jgi:hypothetical protein